MTSHFILAEFELDPRVIIAIGFLVFSALKWFSSKFKSQEDGSDSSGLEDIYEQYREEIRRRQTAPQQPPVNQPVVTVQTPPPIPKAQTTNTVKHVEPTTVESLNKIWRKPQPKLTQAEKAALKKIQSDKATVSRKSRTRRLKAETQYTKLLSSPASAKQAIVLSEILGPPKGMR